ncbi:MAG: hypothetical protein AAFZ17_16385 [Cyanobacteria bacterium J06650_10]
MKHSVVSNRQINLEIAIHSAHLSEIHPAFSSDICINPKSRFYREMQTPTKLMRITTTAVNDPISNPTA